MRLFRKPKTDPELPADVRIYAEGLADGTRIALELTLGRVPEAGGSPYTGPMPDELRAWLEAALRRAKQWSPCMATSRGSSPTRHHTDVHGSDAKGERKRPT